MLSHLFRQLFHFEFPEDGGSGIAAPAVEPDAGVESEWAGPSAEEWDTVLGFIQAQQAAGAEQYGAEQADAYRAELADAFDQFSPDFDPERGMQMLQQLVQAQTAPIQQALEERQDQDALAEAEDLAADLLDEFEVPEELHQEVVDLASDLINERALALVLHDHGLSIEQIQTAAQSPDPAARQWADQWAEWANSAASELISGKQEVGRAAIEMAKNILQHGSQAEAHIAAGGSIADMVFGGGPLRGRASAGDYTQGESVSGRMFSGR